ncbi:hypothetical protein GAGA_3999 [Paraglaciecola agarilytica NO2]|uniref:Uncharacterized protein n=1 Tax=Paraglaciecola agarilytica NO2 TaxID=1125747 RepID=A0ABQ0IBR1_9ALTE|nr:hypothetical protein GAGA_3999 [Paraglaciecola agarilytica NO2]
MCFVGKEFKLFFYALFYALFCAQPMLLRTSNEKASENS